MIEIETVPLQVVNEVKTDAEIIDSYLNGTLTGIYIRDNSFFINLRVTGLGITRRLNEEASAQNLIRALSQFKDIPEQELDFSGLCKLAKSKGLQPHNFFVFSDVDRREEEFANPKTLELYSGLPILVGHPKEGLLTYENFSYNSIVGSVIKAYKLNNAVFAIARIYDLSLLDKLDKFKSTSPAVVSVDVEDNGKLKELPIIFNHLAFVENGHWDQISDYAIDGSKILIEGDKMAITEVIEANKVDAITDVVATPEAKEVKADDEIVKVESMLTPEVVDEDEVVAIDEDEVVAIDEDEVVAIDEDEVVAIDEDEVVAIDEDEVTVVHPPVEVISGTNTDEDLTAEAKSEGITDVTKTIECDEDKERENLIDAMRKTVDSASNLKDVRMPYIEGRKKPSFVIRALLRSNRQYVDSKFQDVIDSGIASYKNYALYVDAFNDMLSNIQKANDRLAPNKISKTNKGWTVAGDNPNILVDRSF